MLEGLYRLKENGKFSSSKTAKENKAEFMRASDPFNAWINDCVVFVPEAFLTRQEAFNNYRDYTDELGADPDSPRTFYSKMRQTPRIKDTQIRVQGKGTRVFQGITFKTELEMEKSQTKLESVADVADVASTTSQLQKNLKNSKEVISPATSATSATPPSVDIDKAFTQIVCFDCRRILTEDTPYTHYDGKPICFTCFNKIEAQKKTEENS
jgi:hypothetical protein